MKQSEKTKLLEDNLARLLGLISAADTKASIILAIYTAMLGVMAVFIPPFKCWTTSLVVICALPALGVASGMLFLSFTMFPRTKGPTNSLIYFGAIAKRKLEAYSQEMSELTSSDYLRDLMEQCYCNSQIADKKHRWLRRSLATLYVSSPLWFLALYLLYQLKG